MKRKIEKRNKLILIIITLVILLFATFLTIDYFRVKSNKTPLFALPIIKYKDGGSVEYWGIGYKVIKCNSSSGDKKAHMGFYSLDINKDNLCNDKEAIPNFNFTIIDEMENRNGLCDEALEFFYEDAFFSYWFACIKSDWVFIKFNDGTKYTLKEALNDSRVSIKDVEDYYEGSYPSFNKTLKVEIKIEEAEDSTSIKQLIFPKTSSYVKPLNYKLFSYGLDKVLLFNPDRSNVYILEEALRNNNITIEDLITSLEFSIPPYGFGTKVVYDEGGSILYTTSSYALLKCNTIEGNRDYYIGNVNMKYESNFCK